MDRDGARIMGRVTALFLNSNQGHISSCSVHVRGKPPHQRLGCELSLDVHLLHQPQLIWNVLPVS